jgi:hypothetical protein
VASNKAISRFISSSKVYVMVWCGAGAGAGADAGVAKSWEDLMLYPFFCVTWFSSFVKMQQGIYRWQDKCEAPWFERIICDFLFAAMGAYAIMKAIGQRD